MEQRDILTAIGILVLSVAVGFGMGLEFSQDSQEKFTSFPDVRVDSTSQVQKLDFDNHSLDLMFEDRDEADFYIDKDRDGSFDIELENLTQDGEEREAVQVVTFGTKSYRIFYRYRDNISISEDAYLEVYQVKEM